MNALTLICREVEKKYQEFSLTAVATAFSLGIVLANGAGLLMQCELYKTHGIVDGCFYHGDKCGSSSISC